MNCKYCGEEMTKKDKFCPKCGRYLEENDKKTDPGKRKKIISIVMAVVAVVFIVGVFGISFSPQNSKVANEIVSKVKKVEETKSAHTLKLKPEEFKDKFSFDIRTIFNTQEECKIIKEYFKVFLFKVDFPTRSQMVRHRISWQELSRRYVSAKRVPFEFYVSEKLKENQKVQDLIKQSEDLYFELLEAGVKPQEARRVIPQMGYTQIWGAFMPKQLDNYFKLRLDEHAQWEIRQTAIAMQELLR